MLISFSGRTKQIFFLVIKLEPPILSWLQPRKNNCVPTELDVSISANVVPSLISKNLWQILLEMKKKKKLRKKFKIANSKKNIVSKSSILENSRDYSKDQSLKFRQGNLRIGDFEKLRFFGLAILDLFSQSCFLHHSHEYLSTFMDVKDETKFWWLFWFPAKNHPP